MRDDWRFWIYDFGFMTGEPVIDGPGGIPLIPGSPVIIYISQLNISGS